MDVNTAKPYITNEARGRVTNKEILEVGISGLDYPLESWLSGHMYGQ